MAKNVTARADSERARPIDRATHNVHECLLAFLGSDRATQDKVARLFGMDRIGALAAMCASAALDAVLPEDAQWEPAGSMGWERWKRTGG